MDAHGRVRASQTLPARVTLTASAVLDVTPYFRMADFNCAVTVLGYRDSSTAI
ncbi:hypothetical protein [Streptomyces sp. NPDC058394]|uniref:hypothetical protein n=1 Tax=unclassified Streptomyces TaxID=2593676 RepID=UPI003664BB12